jgi:phosphatidylinositol glycan class B
MSFWQNLRANSGLADDPEWRRFVGRWAAVSLLLIAVTCYFSYGFFQFDEYYQITEFVSYKLGKTPPGELAWEFHQQIRPWTQPAIYYAAARAAMAAGIENPFTLSLLFRAISGLCGWAAVVSMMLSARVFFSDRGIRRMAVISLALLWLIPYLAVRTSSESLSGDFFAIGVALLLLGSSAVEGGGRRFPIAALLTAGLCFGLAFDFRYQIAFAVAGVVFWVAIVGCENRRRGIATAALILAGVVPPLVIGTALDCWGYGGWTLAPWNYFLVNIVNHKADEFGTAPVWWYFYLMNEGLLAPITLLWTAAMLFTWVRHPRHIVTWATLPFFAAHSIVAHKELRFLFPMTLVGVFFFLLAFAPQADGREPSPLRWLWERRRSWPARLLYTANLVALAVACLTAKRPGVELQKYIYDHYGQGTHAYLLGKKNPYQNVGVNMFFYRPKGFVYKELKSYDQLKEVLRTGPQRFLLITDQISLAGEQAEIAPQATLVWRSYPSWLENYNYLHWLDRSKTFSMYAIDSGERAAEIGAKTARADKR